MNLNTLPVISFIRRKFWLIVVTVAMIALCFNDTIWKMFGLWAYGIAVVFASAFMAFLLRNLIFRNIDKNADPKDPDCGDFRADFRNSSPDTRVYALVIVSGLLFLGCCIVLSQIPVLP
jgi:hypothetical protein